ncbi:IclR family transcriptional regulator [Mycobacterium sp. 1245852.3]|uniref:IclR family transcriptional regulator n=1 Tax=Mycobacterium sp. 1245852.3 TaxID=1856860 RepID=UPI00082C23F9
MARSTSGEGVLERAVRILEVFDGDTAMASVTDIATKAGLPLSTASRLVDELIGHGLLRRDHQRRVHIGIRLWELGCRASLTHDLLDAAMPSLQQLHSAIGHHVQIGILETHEVLFIERLSAPGGVRNLARVGGRLPLHASASGLVLLAYAPTELQHRIVNRPLPRLADQTVTDPKLLCVILAEIRRIGYAACPASVNAEATGFAVPIKDAAGTVIAALSVVVPRGTPASRCIPALLAAADRIRGAITRPAVAAVAVDTNGSARLGAHRSFPIGTAAHARTGRPDDAAVGGETEPGGMRCVK